MVDYENDAWKVALGIPLPRKYYALYFDDGHCELFSKAMQRAERLVELDSQRKLSKVIGGEVLEIPKVVEGEAILSQ